ncbi:MAG: hypothetical protein NTW28_38130 [Candidatus Solibacter sp.]|nr:hypothetical protein [Candidatus Solibacter sp.]
MDSLNPYSLVLPNHARLVALPGSADNVRGFSAVSLLLVDEAAFVPDPLYHALTPTLAVSGGALWLMSTPGAQCGFFYDTWHSADPLWRRVSVPAAACPRISQAFLDEQRLALGETAFRREFCCEFLASDLAIFPRELFDAAFDPNLEPANHGRPYFRD